MNALPLNNHSWISINFSNFKLQSPCSQKPVLTGTDLFKNHQIPSSFQLSAAIRIQYSKELYSTGGFWWDTVCRAVGQYKRRKCLTLPNTIPMTIRCHQGLWWGGTGCGGNSKVGNEKLELEIGFSSNFQLEIGSRIPGKQQETESDSAQCRICPTESKMSVSSSHSLCLCKEKCSGVTAQKNESQAGGAAVQLNFNLSWEKGAVKFNKAPGWGILVGLTQPQGRSTASD